jgi:CRISPR system Cascade subunit CasE
MFYLLSDEAPEDRDGYWSLATKPFEPRLKAGMRLQFDLRLNPVKKSRDANGRQHRHDLVMDMKRDLRDGENGIDMPALQQAAGLKWVASRADQYGFRLVDDALLAEGYRQHRFHPGKKKSPIRFSSLDVKGLLEITDVEAFQAGLYHGIGPAKSFGCGLLLVRPA